MNGRFTLRVYCRCGASMIGSGVGETAAATDLQAAFWRVHDGEGHGTATRSEAANARRRQERRAIKQGDE